MTFFSPAMSASTDWRIAVSLSNLLECRECQTCHYITELMHPTMQNYSSLSFHLPFFPQTTNTYQKLRTSTGNILHFKVVSSKTGVVNLEDQTSVVRNAVKDLDGDKKKKSLLERNLFKWILKSRCCVPTAMFSITNENLTLLCNHRNLHWIFHNLWHCYIRNTQQKRGTTDGRTGSRDVPEPNQNQVSSTAGKLHFE